MTSNHIHESLSVSHPAKFNNFISNFKCSITGPQSCQCKCESHPTGCYSAGYKWANARKGHAQAIVSNYFSGVASFTACSDMCTNHPECTHWQYEMRGSIKHHESIHVSAGQTCILMKGKAGPKVLAPGQNYAGYHNNAKESLNVCPTNRPSMVKRGAGRAAVIQCPAGKWLLEKSNVRACFNCPKGKYTRFANMPSCQKRLN